MMMWISNHRYSVISLSIYWLCAGLIPLLTVLNEFGYSIGFTYARFYSPLFFYPVIFGPITVYFFLRPFFFLLRLHKDQRLGLSIRTLLLFVVLMSISVTAVEFSGRAAIWEIKKPAIESTIQELRKNGRISEIRDWDNFIDHFSKHPKDPAFNEFGVSEQYREAKLKLEKTRKDFSTIVEYAARKPSNWSATRYTYFLSFFIQQTAMLLLFLTISFLSMPKLKEEIEKVPLIESVSKANKESSLQRKQSLSNQLILLSCALTFSLFWFFMRLPFDLDKSDLYGTSLVSNSAATTAIGVLYVLATLYVTLTLMFTFNEKFQVVYNTIITLIGITATVRSTQSGGNFLGSDASPQNYIICVIVSAIVLFPWFIAYKDILE